MKSHYLSVLVVLLGLLAALGHFVAFFGDWQTAFLAFGLVAAGAAIIANK